jgi:hypothetical protein
MALETDSVGFDLLDLDSMPMHTPLQSPMNGITLLSPTEYDFEINASKMICANMAWKCGERGRDVAAAMMAE